MGKTLDFVISVIFAHVLSRKRAFPAKINAVEHIEHEKIDEKKRAEARFSKFRLKFLVVFFCRV